MLFETLEFIRTDMLVHARIPASVAGGEAISFPEISGAKTTLSAGNVNIVLLNLQEEKGIRPEDPYVRAEPDGTVISVSPPLRLHLLVMFASANSNYSTALRNLNLIIKYFQARPVFESSRFPGMPEEIEKIIPELQSLTLNQQNEVWGMIQNPHLPSVVYKLRMMVFQQEAIQGQGIIQEINNNLIQP